MSRISDHGLIEVTDLDINMAFAIRDGAEVAYVAVSTDPHCGTAWYRLDCRSCRAIRKTCGCCRGRMHAPNAPSLSCGGQPKYSGDGGNAQTCEIFFHKIYESCLA